MFLLREGYKFSSCRLAVAKRRFERSKDAVNGAATPDEMKTYTEVMKSAEMLVKRFEATQNILDNTMTKENLDTTAIRQTAGLH